MTLRAILSWPNRWISQLQRHYHHHLRAFFHSEQSPRRAIDYFPQHNRTTTSEVLCVLQQGRRFAIQGPMESDN